MESYEKRDTAFLSPFLHGRLLSHGLVLKCSILRGLKIYSFLFVLWFVIVVIFEMESCKVAQSRPRTYSVANASSTGLMLCN